MRDQARSPSVACARSSPSAKAATSPGEAVPPANGNARIACCWRTFAQLSTARRRRNRSPRLTRELQEAGLKVARRRTARLMRDNGLRARPKRRFTRTTDSHHAHPIAPNLLDQDFSAERPDEKWGSDISSIWTREGWLSRAVVIDLFARRVVGWAVSERLRTDLALTALRRALALRRPAPGLIHHADRGSQYCSAAYQAELRAHGFQVSMAGRGNCFDSESVGVARGT